MVAGAGAGGTLAATIAAEVVPAGGTGLAPGRVYEVIARQLLEPLALVEEALEAVPLRDALPRRLRAVAIEVRLQPRPRFAQRLRGVVEAFSRKSIRV